MKIAERIKIYQELLLSEKCNAQWVSGVIFGLQLALALLKSEKGSEKNEM